MLFLRCLALSIIALPQIAPAEVVEHTTPAGHVFHYVEMPAANRTAIVVDWQSDWALSAENPTAAHIAAVLITSGGAGGREANTLVAEFESLDAHVEFNATADGVRGILATGSDQLPAAAALINEMLGSLRIDPASFVPIRDHLASSIREAKTSSDVLAWDAARRFVLGDSPLYGFLTLPVEMIEATTLAEIEAWYAAVFARENATITAAGAAIPADVAIAVDTLLEGLPETPARTSAPRPKPQFRGTTVLITTPDVETSAIAVVGPLPPSREGSDLQDVIALRILGSGDRSRLNRALRKNLGDSFEFSAGPANYTRDLRVLVIGVAVESSDVRKALDVVRATYENFRTKGLREREAAIGARRLARAFEDAEREPEIVAQAVMELRLEGRPVTMVHDLPERIHAITRRDLEHRLAQAFPPYESMLRVVVAPTADAVRADCVIASIDEIQTCR